MTLLLLAAPPLAGPDTTPRASARANARANVLSLAANDPVLLGAWSAGLAVAVRIPHLLGTLHVWLRPAAAAAVVLESSVFAVAPPGAVGVPRA